MLPYQRESSATVAAVTSCFNTVKRYYLVYWLLVFGLNFKNYRNILSLLPANVVVTHHIIPF